MNNSDFVYFKCGKLEVSVNLAEVTQVSHMDNSNYSSTESRLVITYKGNKDGKYFYFKDHKESKRIFNKLSSILGIEKI